MFFTTRGCEPSDKYWEITMRNKPRQHVGGVRRYSWPFMAFRTRRFAQSAASNANATSTELEEVTVTANRREQTARSRPLQHVGGLHPATRTGPMSRTWQYACQHRSRPQHVRFRCPYGGRRPRRSFAASTPRPSPLAAFALSSKPPVGNLHRQFPPSTVTFKLDDLKQVEVLKGPAGHLVWRRRVGRCSATHSECAGCQCVCRQFRSGCRSLGALRRYGLYP